MRTESKIRARLADIRTLRNEAKRACERETGHLGALTRLNGKVRLLEWVLEESRTRYFVKNEGGSLAERTEVWILRRTNNGAWVCAAITPEQEDEGERPGDPEWVDEASIEEMS